MANYYELMDGLKLKGLREKKNLTQKNIADILGVKSSFISAVEHWKKVIPANNIKLWAECYGLSEEDITMYYDAWRRKNKNECNVNEVNLINQEVTKMVINRKVNIGGSDVKEIINSRDRRVQEFVNFFYEQIRTENRQIDILLNIIKNDCDD